MIERRMAAGMAAGKRRGCARHEGRRSRNADVIILWAASGRALWHGTCNTASPCGAGFCLVWRVYDSLREMPAGGDAGQYWTANRTHLRPAAPAQRPAGGQISDPGAIGSVVVVAVVRRHDFTVRETGVLQSYARHNAGCAAVPSQGSA